jgi:ABC-type dipeptide/oligopeptide/nickel transport system permease subunit
LRRFWFSYRWVRETRSWQSQAFPYLGLGIQPPQPEWGSMLTSAKIYMRDAWQISIFPGLVIMLTVLLL